MPRSSVESTLPARLGKLDPVGDARELAGRGAMCTVPPLGSMGCIDCVDGPGWSEAWLSGADGCDNTVDMGCSEATGTREGS
jgi:hypothetical protein